MYSFGAACKCQEQSSVKIRKGIVFLCRILLITTQDSESIGPHIATKRNLSDVLIIALVHTDADFLCALLPGVQDCDKGQVTFALSVVKAGVFVRGFSARDFGRETAHEPLCLPSSRYMILLPFIEHFIFHLVSV